jgi:hypothetical protein
MKVLKLPGQQLHLPFDNDAMRMLPRGLFEQAEPLFKAEDVQDEYTF